MRSSIRPWIRKSAIFFTVFFLWIAATALFPQTARPPAAGQRGPATAAAQPAKDASAPSELDKLKADQEKTKKATEVARDWFRKLNALDGSKESIDRFVDLYQSDALQIVSPHADEQMGPSVFEGHDMIRKFAEKTAKDYSRLAYFIRQRTVNNKTAELMVANVGPFGDVTMALEFSGSVNIKEGDAGKDTPSAQPRTSEREGGGVSVTEEARARVIGKEKRLTVPGAAFFDIKDGKITRLRIIYAAGESFPVGGTWILSL